MIVMPANATGWFWHCLARETGRIGHLFSPGAQRGPWPWMPYAMDNGAFSCWEPTTNTFDAARWDKTETAWRHLLMWAQCAPIKARWAIVPDVLGNSAATLARWPLYAPDVVAAGIPLAIAVQDGMTADDVRKLSPAAAVVCVGGSTDWKWATAEQWVRDFPRVHVLRCNSPEKLYWLEAIGAESTDGTGWNRGDRRQTAGVEAWARSRAVPTGEQLWPHASRAVNRKQLCFA
jgi:hypothetical protein